MQRILLQLYDSFVISCPPRHVDAIWVLAGRMERKHYGIELFRGGFASKVILSVGRFEVSRMNQIDGDLRRKLVELRDILTPDQRNFLITLDRSGFAVRRADFPAVSTYGEALGFLRLWERAPDDRTVMIVSTDIHLRRVAATYRKVFKRCDIQFLYSPVPQRLSTLQRSEWWKRPEDRRYVLSELLKLAGYRLLRPFPDSAIVFVVRQTRRIWKLFSRSS